MYQEVEITYLKGRTQYKIAKRTLSMKLSFLAGIDNFEQLIKVVVRGKCK
jgi:hypothetical protein